MPIKILPVILSGGSGTRLWPLSRESYPKQLIPLVGEHSLLQKTVLRLGKEVLPPLVICNESHRFLVAEQLRQINCQPAAIILESVARNTAPAIAIAALYAEENFSDAALLILPADHLVQDEAGFKTTIQQAIGLLGTEDLLTFGVKPSSAHTGYGYIETELKPGLQPIKSFTEKPSQDVAERYLVAGNYCWNSGMFMFVASCYLAELAKFAPKILQACQAAFGNKQVDLDFLRLGVEFADSPSDSIDYAVMEKTQKSKMLPLASDWSDVGSWGSLSEVQSLDSVGNAMFGDVVSHAVTNSYLRSDGRLLAAVGVDNLIVISSKDAVLVADKSKSEQVKEIVTQLKAAGRTERLHHTVQYRPWGQHELLVEQPGFQVRLVQVKSGKAISLQKHAKRSEHWVVVAGVANLIIADAEHKLRANQSFYVPAGVAHKIKNKAGQLLEFIEIQIGKCLKDDDITRL